MEITGIFRAQPRRISTKLTKVKSVYKTYVDVIHYRESVKQVTSVKKMRTSSSGMNAVLGLTPERIQQIKAMGERDDIYDVLTEALAPSIWEMDNVKRGVLCMLFGGNNRRVQRGHDGALAKKNNSDEDEISSENGIDEEGQDENTEKPLNKRGDINILLCGGKFFSSCLGSYFPLKYSLFLIFYYTFYLLFATYDRSWDQQITATYLCSQN